MGRNSGGSIVIGNNAQIALTDTEASSYGAVAIGEESIATERDTVSFGREADFDDSVTRRLVHVSDGIADSDAATVGQMNTAIAVATSGFATSENLGAAQADATQALADAAAAQGTADTALAATLVNASGIQTNAEAIATLSTGGSANAEAIAANTAAISGNSESIAALETTTATNSGKLEYLSVEPSGNGARATGANALAVGEFARASGERATALGGATSAAGDNSTAVGRRAATAAYASTAVGYLSSATANFATAAGNEASASGVNSTALGSGATTTHRASTAIGYLATTTAENQVMLGGAGSSVVIADIDASTDAQQGPVDVVTVDANGVLGRQQVASAASVSSVIHSMNSIAAVTDAQFAALSNSVSVLDGRVGALEQGFADMGFRLESLDNSAMGGIAAAMALGQGKIVPDADISMTVGAATYAGQQGYAGSLTGKLAEKLYVSAGISGNTGDDHVGGTVSATIGF